MQDKNPIYNDCDLSKEESHLLILAQALRHNLPDVALQTSINLVDCHLPSVLHGSKYSFLKPCPEPKVIAHYFCPKCLALINFENINRAECNTCKVEYNKKNLEKNKNYFFYLPLEDQLKQLISTKHFLQFRKNCDESDIVNSKEYLRLVEKNVISANDITIQWNTDGIAVSNSSIRSVWPILVTVNELPYRLRKNNMLLCGLWFGKTKPPMNLFLRPFVNELIHLHDNGFTSTTFLSNEPILIKVHTLVSPVDSGARPGIQNTKQYNGKFGCPYCLHRGKRVPVGRGFSRVYCGHMKKLRTLKQHNRDAERANGNKPIHGVKGHSVVSLIPLFHIIKSFPPEYLHSVLEGVTQLLLTSLFSSNNSKEKWSLSKKANLIDQKLLDMKPPSEVTRTPRSLQNLNKWKASELRTFLLYYSLPCFHGNMLPKYFEHWFLFVYSITIFCKAKITEAEFVEAKTALCTFVYNIELLYGREYMKYNVHILLHIPQAVLSFGALWAWSTFPFEHFNGVLKKLFHGTQFIPEQICKFYSRLSFIHSASEIFSKENCSKRGKKLFRTLMKECTIKKCIYYGDYLRIFGSPKCVNLTLTEKFVIEEALAETIDPKAQSFTRFIYKNVLYHTSNNSRIMKRNNCTIETTDGRFMSISDLIIVKLTASNEYKHVLLGKELEKQDKILCKVGNVSSNYFSCIAKETNNIISCPLLLIKTKCVNVRYNETEVYIEPLVNHIETD